MPDSNAKYDMNEIFALINCTTANLRELADDIGTFDDRIGKAKEREAIQKKIQEAAKKRSKFIADKRKESANEEGNTLDAVMLKAVREQAEKKAFKFEK